MGLLLPEEAWQRIAGRVAGWRVTASEAMTTWDGLAGSMSSMAHASARDTLKRISLITTPSTL